MTDAALVRKLTALAEDKAAKKKLIKAKDYLVPVGDSTLKLQSWRMQDYAYKTEPCPFPTRARGLFTVDAPLPDGRSILIRGYDKFFNVGEVSWTQWPNIAQHAQAPFYLTVKSNGCIIFIAALSPSELIVTSKHALGDEAQGFWHAIKGRQWLDQCLARVNKTQSDLASVLWTNRWTAVAELCDDSFEEHVLAYAPEETGLHLHGVNANTRLFSSLKPEEVSTFAKDWGFIETQYLVMNSVDEVKSFTDACSNDDGQWNGKHVEGFVVRSHNIPSTSSQSQSGDTFMFKVKFEQPYLRWREWRELTRRMLTYYKKNGATMQPDNTLLGINPTKLKHPDTKAYATWVADEIRQKPESFKEWELSRGIVATRERFLAWYTHHGVASEKPRNQPLGSTREDYDRVLIIPIAIPGCGKTLMGVALARLFGFEHTQSDDVNAKSTTKGFLANVTKLLKTNSVVIADRNNHLAQHRAQLAGLSATPALKDHRVRTVALHWDVDSHPLNSIHRICADRIVLRGDAHQSLRADSSEARHHELVLSRFLHERQPVDAALNGDSDGLIDDIIDIDPSLDAPAMLRSICDALVPLLKLETPAPEELSESLKEAKDYKPTLRKAMKTEDAVCRYYALSAEVKLQDFIGGLLRDKGLQCDLWSVLTQTERVERNPHITILHSKNTPDDKDEGALSDFQAFWDECRTLATRQYDFTITVGPRLAWNDRVMTLEVSQVETQEDLGDGSRLHRDTAHRHVTVGTASKEIPGFEGRVLMKEVVEGKHEGVQVVDIGTHRFRGRMKGMS